VIRDWYKTLTWLMWVALPTTALNYWRAWDELPHRMAVHFDANWQPNGYTSREGALMLGLGIMATLLVLFTVGALAARALKPSASWPLLMVFYLVLAVLWTGNHYIVEHNLNAQPAHSELVGLPPVTSDSEEQNVVQRNLIHREPVQLHS
jgi:hypothetical protein